MNDSARELRYCLEALSVGLVLLKVAHVVGLSWWWVTAPFWAPVLASVVLYGAGNYLKKAGQK